jgi:hypothetical protein
MSRGYNLHGDYPYTNRIREKILNYQKENPEWEPTITYHKKGLLGNGMDDPELLGGNASVASGQRTVGFNNYAKYSNYYKQVPKGYKSSGNDGNDYYHINELEKLNKGNFPYINYDKNKLNNANQPVKKEDVEVFDSIQDVVKRKMDTRQLKGGKSSLNVQEKILHDAVVNAYKKSGGYEMSGGKLDKDKFKKAFKISKSLGKKLLVPTIKIGMPVVAGAIASSLGIPVPVAVVLAKIGADVITSEIKKGGGFATIHPNENRSLSRPIGGSNKGPSYTRAEQQFYTKFADAIKKIKTGGSYEGGVDEAHFKKTLKIPLPMARSLCPSSVMDISQSVGTQLGIEPDISNLLGKVAVDVISQKKLSKKKGEGVGKYTGGKTPASTGGMTKQKRRSIKVKEIMTQRGVSLPKASKIIKEENIEY